jgi:hypothetical protein
MTTAATLSERGLPTADLARFITGDTGTLIAEISDLGPVWRLRGAPRRFIMVGANEVVYTCVGTDRNGDDVAGWRYQNHVGGQALIIND